jgi:hypothetical protein
MLYAKHRIHRHTQKKNKKIKIKKNKEIIYSKVQCQFMLWEKKKNGLIL